MFLDHIIQSRRPTFKELRTRVEKNDGEKPLRSFVKTLTWRAIGTLDTLVISYFITHQESVALSIASVELISKMILYYLHERAWTNVKWGKRKK